MNKLANGCGLKPKTSDQRSDHRKVNVVYFHLVQFPGLDRPPVIKIGETGNHNKRLNDLSKPKFGLVVDVAELCVVRGNRADEQSVLRYFDGSRLDNEVETFRTSDDLVDYIRWLRDQYFTWVPDCKLCPPIADMEEVDSSLWMPSPDRRKGPPKQSDLFGGFGPLNLPPRDVTVDDFYTNPVIIDAARNAMGGIDLDPASHAFANTVVSASRFYSIRDNGLAQLWSGKVWLNPPFSQWQLWVPKIVGEWKSGRIEAMCLLCATRTLTAQYFGPIHDNASAMCILHGRIPFWGDRASSPDDGHAIFYFGGDVGQFSRAFGELGFCYPAS